MMIWRRPPLGDNARMGEAALICWPGRRHRHRRADDSCRHTAAAEKQRQSVRAGRRRAASCGAPAPPLLQRAPPPPLGPSSSPRRRARHGGVAAMCAAGSRRQCAPQQRRRAEEPHTWPRAAAAGGACGLAHGACSSPTVRAPAHEPSAEACEIQSSLDRELWIGAVDFLFCTKLVSFSVFDAQLFVQNHLALSKVQLLSPPYASIREVEPGQPRS
jgi:hypothetical protein